MAKEALSLKMVDPLDGKVLCGDYVLLPGPAACSGELLLGWLEDVLPLLVRQIRERGRETDFDLDTLQFIVHTDGNEATVGWKVKGKPKGDEQP